MPSLKVPPGRDHSKLVDRLAQRFPHKDGASNGIEFLVARFTVSQSKGKKGAPDFTHVQYDDDLSRADIMQVINAPD